MKEKMYNHLSWLNGVTGTRSMMIFKYFHLRGAQKHIKRKIDPVVNLWLSYARERIHSRLAGIARRRIPVWCSLWEDFISRNGPQEEAVKQAAKKGNDRKQVDGVYRESQRGRMQQGRLSSPSIEKQEAAEWDGATIWPQRRAVRCRSAKINDNNSTLDAHHYPDGVLGERRRPLTASRDAADQTPPPNSMVSRCCFCVGDRAKNRPPRPSATEPSVGFKLAARDGRIRRARWTGGRQQRKQAFPTTPLKQRSSINRSKRVNTDVLLQEKRPGTMHTNTFTCRTTAANGK